MSASRQHRLRRCALAIGAVLSLGASQVFADQPQSNDLVEGGPLLEASYPLLSSNVTQPILASAETPTTAEAAPDSEYQALLDRIESLEAYKLDQEDAAAAKKKKSAYKLNGRIHLDNWLFSNSDPGINELENGIGNPGFDPENRWDFRRIRLTWTGTVPNNMNYRIQIDFHNPQTPELKDVYLGFTDLPHNHTFLIGIQKRPIGLDHLNSSRHNVFAERPLAVETFNEDARRLGMCFYGLSDDESMNWRYGAFLLENITSDGAAIGDKEQGGLYGRFAASPWYDEISGGRGYYHWAISGSVNQTDGDGTTDVDTNSNEARFRTRPEARSSNRWWNTGRILGANQYQQLGVESMLNIGTFSLTGEYIGNWVQRDASGGFNGDDLFFHGGYLYGCYFLTGEHIPLKRSSGTIDRVKPFENFFLVDRCRGGCGSGWGALALALRGDYLDLSDSDINGGQGYTVTAGLNWYWTAYSKLQVNYITGHISDAGQDVNNANATPFGTPLAGDFDIFGMRYMLDF